MKNEEGNEVAYPGGYGQRKGLTKRELLAAMAMQGMAANPYVDQPEETLAKWSVKYADALIAELSKEGGAK